MNYFLRIDGVYGDSADKAHAGWFEISDLSLTALLDAGKSGDLGSVSFSSDFSRLLTPLLSGLSDGGVLGPIQIQSVSSTGAVLQDLRLDGVTVSGYDTQGLGGIGSSARITLDATRFGLFDYGLNAQGAAVLDSEFGWDASTQSAIDASRVATPATGTTDRTTSAPIDHYFLRIDGVQGDATYKGFEGWFELPSFQWSALNASGVGGLGDWGPLGLQLPLGMGLTSLLMQLASGQEIGAVEIQGINATSTSPVYELLLNQVYVTSLERNTDATQSLTLDYARVGQRIAAVDAKTGLPTKTLDFAWDLETGQALKFGELVASTGPGTSALSTGATRYFIQFDGVYGDSLDAKHPGWFELDSFDLQAILPTVLTAGGMQATKGMDFLPIDLNLQLGPALNSLLTRASDNGIIGNVLIEGQAGGATPRTTFSLKLGDVSLQQTDFSDGAVDHLVLDYQQIGLTQSGITEAGTLGSPQTFGWDFTQNQAIDPNAIGNPSNATALPTGAYDAATYYMRVDGVGGDSVSASHKGWFEINSFDMALLRDAASGHLQSDGVNVDLDVGTALPLLLGMAANGQTIAAVEIEGVTTSLAGKEALVYELRLNDVLLQHIQDDQAGNEQLHLVFERFSIDETLITDSGTASSGSTSYAYDLVNGQAINSTLLQAGTGAAQYGQGDLDYFLRIDGIRGDATMKGFEGWFSLNSLGLNLDQLIKLAGSDLQARGADFSSVDLGLDLHLLLPQLLAAQFEGKSLGAVQIWGVTSGINPLPVYDLRLNDVAVIGLDEQATSGSDQLHLAFKQIGLSTNGITSSGTLAPAPTTFGWDLGTNQALDFSQLTTPSTTTGSALQGGAQLQYFLKIDGVYGPSMSKGFEGWFELAAFDLGTDNNGQPAFGHLNLNFDPGSDFAGLLTPLMLGRTVDAIQIQGLASTLNGPVVTQELVLNQVRFTHLDQSPDAPIGLELDFGQVGLTNYPLDAQGKRGTPQVFGYDTALRQPIDPAHLTLPVIGTGVPFVAPVDIDTTTNATTENAAIGGTVGIRASSAAADHYILLSNPDNAFAIDAQTGVVRVARQIAASHVGQTLDIEVGAVSPEGVVKSTVFQLSVGDVPGQTFFGFSTPEQWDGSVLADLAQGNGGNDTLSGGDGNDSLYGGLGNDRLSGDAGDDLIDGGAGVDVAVFAGSAAVMVDLNQSGPQDTGRGMDQLTGIENIISGMGNDRLTGDAKANVLNAIGGNDTLIGGLGNDRLYGGAGDDELEGDAGNDLLNGGSGQDTAVYRGGAATVSLAESGAQYVGAAHGTDTLIDIEHLISDFGNDRLTGNDLANRLSGQGGNDTLTGGAGNDTLDGGNGNDVLQGDAGDDLFLGGAGWDTAVFAGNADITVSLSIGGPQNTGQGMDTLDRIEHITSGEGNDRLTGNALANTLQGSGGNDTLSGLSGNDALFGDAGNDRLNGGNGNDTLVGGLGIDTLSGGAGDDVFRFLSAQEIGYSTERIIDFQTGADQIDLSALGLNLVDSFSHAAGELRIQATLPGQFLLLGDMDGNGGADFKLLVIGSASLSAGDLIL